MNFAIRIATTLAAAATTITCSAQMLSASEVEAMFAKPIKFAYKGTAGGAGRTEYAPDKKAWLSATVPYLNDTGSYRIDGDQHCITWKVMRNGAEGCFRYEKLADGSLKSISKDGTVIGILEIIK